MKNIRQNSLVIDFNVMPVVPDLEKTRNFLMEQVKLEFSSVRNLQVSVSKNQVIIETTSPEEAYRLARDHNAKKHISHENQQYEIPIFVEDGAVEVKVHDLPPRMPNHIITSHLQQFGEVVSIRNEVWRDFFPGIPNGVRAVRMKLCKSIPSFISIGGNSAYVVHSNQTKTCRHCSGKLYSGQKCNETKPKNNTIPIAKTQQVTEQQKTTEKKQVSNLDETMENKEQTPITDIDHFNVPVNPQQTANEPSSHFIDSDTPDLVFGPLKEKTIWRLGRKLSKPGPKICYHKKPNK